MGPAAQGPGGPGEARLRRRPALFRAWLAVRGDTACPELFVFAAGRAMTRSGFEYVLRKHVQAATAKCPSLADRHPSPHVLRHTCALNILQATGDLRKVALWLGHANQRTTEIYLRADPTEKRRRSLRRWSPPCLRACALGASRPRTNSSPRSRRVHRRAHAREPRLAGAGGAGRAGQPLSCGAKARQTVEPKGSEGSTPQNRGLLVIGRTSPVPNVA